MTQPSETEKPQPANTIRIEIRGGCLVDVSGLPEGFTYELIDHDNDDARRALQKPSHQLRDR